MRIKIFTLIKRGLIIWQKKKGNEVEVLTYATTWMTLKTTT